MIRGYFDPNFTDPLPTVRVGLFLPGITPSSVSVNFLLDTGADTTALHPRDAIFRVGINEANLNQPSLWPRRRRAGGVGGTGEYYLHPAHYAFRHDDGRVQVIQADVWIARPSSANETLESLLGWDVLRHFRIELDWGTRQITLGI